MVTVIELKKHRRRNGILINPFSLVINTSREQLWKYLCLGSYIKSTLEKCQQLTFFKHLISYFVAPASARQKKQLQDFIKPICKMLVLHDD